MKRFHILLPVVLVAYAGSAIGQTPVLPSSDAMNTIKNISTPVNHYTGTAGVTIPLMQLSGKELSVPVTLSYNCSGHKVQEIAGSTGLGWNLSAGGMVTRVIRGLPDEEEALRFLTDRNAEKVPDLFFYSFCGQGGKFFLDRNNTPHTMPFRNLKISFPRGTGGTITNFKIIDENGITYLFGAGNEIEQTSVTPAADSKIEDKTTKTHNSSWVLTKINNANRTESIDFTYVESSYSTENKALVATASSVCNSEIQNYSNTTQIKQRLVSSITSSLGKIEFTYLDNRKDLESSTKYLSQIKLSNPGGRRIQTIRLSYSYFSTGCTEKECYRLRLDKIDDQQMTPIYTFSYNTANNLPSRTSEACDYWGYFNNMATITATSSFPKDMIIECRNFSSSQTTDCKENTPYSITDGGDRRVSPNHTQANILNRIEYRGGAYKTFAYEAHLATLYKGSNKEVDSTNITYGGARIKSITVFDGAVTQKQLFDYVNEGDSTSGAIYTIPKFGILTISSTPARYLTSYPLNELTDYNNVGVGYSRVVETIVNADSTVGRKTIYNYSNFDLYNDQMSGEYRLDNSMKRGQLLSSAVLDAGGNKIKEDVYTYNFDLPIITSLGWKEVTSMSASCNEGNNFTNFSATRRFKFIEKPVRLTSQVATTYRNGLSQSIQTDYEYNSVGQVSSTTQWNTNNPTEKQVTRSTYLTDIVKKRRAPYDSACSKTLQDCLEGSVYSEGDEKRSHDQNCYFSYDDCIRNSSCDIPTFDTLYNRNQINIPLEITTSLIKGTSETVLSSQLSVVENSGHMVYLKEAYSMNEPVTDYQNLLGTSSGYQKDSRLRLLSTNNSIDNKGNITQQTDKYGISTAYTYDSWNTPTQTTLTSNADVRTSTMTYIPLVGTTSKTDANSLSSYTDYDTLGRVKFTKDQNQDIVKRNQYHTAGESIGFDISGNTSGCLSNSFTFEASNMAYTRGNPPTFLWEFGDGKSTRTTTASVTHTWTTAGTYNVRVTAFNDVYEPVVENKSVEVFSKPSFALTETDNGNCNFTITSDYSGPTATYTWEYKQMGTTSDENWNNLSGSSNSVELNLYDPVYDPANESHRMYLVQLTITNFCGVESGTRALSVSPCN